MLSWQEALDTVLAHIEPMPTQKRPLESSQGYILSEDVYSTTANPAFDNTAMDGFAVRHGDLVTASTDNPVILSNRGEIAAGDPPGTHLAAGDNCVAIMTGAPMPIGADAVVPVENITRDGDQISFNAAPEQGAHIRTAGSDFAANTVMAKAGNALSGLSILSLAAAGISQLPVFKQPKIGFVSTGKELVDDLNEPLLPGQIYNSSRPGILAQLDRFGAKHLVVPTIGDDQQDLETAIHTMGAAGCQLMVSTGAVSMGNHDFVATVLKGLGAEILFHRIKLRPGKPNLCAVFPDGRVYLGLPGNPVSTACGMRFFIKPAIDKMLGRPAEKPLRAKLHAGSFRKKPGFTHMLKGRAFVDDHGQLQADILDGQMSYQVAPLIAQNCWIALSEEVTDTETGMIIDIWPVGGGLLQG